MAAGQKRILVIDNASTYPPLLRYYEACQHFEVRFAGRNLGPDAPWTLCLEQLRTRFIVSDPDVVPAPGCPRDLVKKLHLAADCYRASKVGPALRIDNLPDCYARKQEVLDWEKQFWCPPADGPADGRLVLQAPSFRAFHAPIDTTFALYAAGAGRWPAQPHIRLGAPYVIEHLPWYEDSAVPSEEREFYRRHAVAEWNHW